MDSLYCSSHRLVDFEPFAIVELNNCSLFGYKLSDPLVEWRSGTPVPAELSAVDSFHCSSHRLVDFESFAIVELKHYLLFDYKLSDPLIEPHPDIRMSTELLEALVEDLQKVLSVLDLLYCSLHMFGAFAPFAIAELKRY